MRIWFSILGAGVLMAAGGMFVSVATLPTKAEAAGAATAKGTGSTPGRPAPAATANRLYDFALTRIDGRPMPLANFQGKVVLLVNTASFCGFTPQYEGLQRLQKRYGAQGFTVLGVPSGDFKSQEYGSNSQIQQFCESRFGITFPMAEKAVVSGPNALPLYRWVKSQIATENEPKWNFHKFLIGKDGRVIAGFNSQVTPESPQLQTAIEQALRG